MPFLPLFTVQKAAPFFELELLLCTSGFTHCVHAIVQFNNGDLPHPCCTCEQAKLPVLTVASPLRTVALLEAAGALSGLLLLLLRPRSQLFARDGFTRARGGGSGVLQLIFVDDYLIIIPEFQ